MFNILVYSILFSGAAAAAIFSYFIVLGVVQLNSHRDIGFFHYGFYGILFAVAVGTVTSGRDFSQVNWLIAATEIEVRGPLASWISRIVSVFLLIVSLERIASVALKMGKFSKFNLLLSVFIGYWFCAVASPSFFGRYPQFSYEYTYPLFIGWAALLLSEKESKLVLIAVRNASLAFIFASLILIPLKTSLVLETSYSQGFIPGLPRLAGLSPHALQLGLLVQIALLCLWIAPIRRHWINRTAWLMALFALFLAQSKTAWLSFSLCVVVMVLVRNGPAVRKRVFDSTRPAAGIIMILAVMLAILLCAYELTFGNFGGKIIGFFDTKEGATLLTLNGREEIWAVAFQEWHRSPIFGYGPSLLSLAHRTSVGLLNATHAHNQFVDDLARAGLVGAIGLIIYVTVLMIFSLKYARYTGGLSICLFLVIAIRGVSEVPLTMYGYSSDFLAHIFLLIVIAGAIENSTQRNVNRKLQSDFSTSVKSY